MVSVSYSKILTVATCQSQALCPKGLDEMLGQCVYFVNELGPLILGCNHFLMCFHSKMYFKSCDEKVTFQAKK